MMKQNDAAFSAEHRQYIARLNRSRRGIKLARWLILIVFIALWELFARVGIIDPFIGSSPVRVAETIARLYAGGELFLHIGVTLYETVLGFVLGTAAGTLIAIMLWWSPAINRVLDPYLVVLNALPKIALGPILIVWFGEKQLLMKTLGASKLQIFTMVVLPASLPTIMNALKISVGMSWVGVIVGEYLVSKAGLGYLIVYGGQVFKLDLVMASIVVLCLLAALMYYGVAYMEKKLVKWRMHGG